MVEDFRLEGLRCLMGQRSLGIEESEGSTEEEGLESESYITT